MTLVAGVDCSTQATKVVLVDADTGEVVAGGRARHEVITTADGTSETDPAIWWEALGAALDETGRASEIEAISVAGQQHGLVVCDAAGEPLRPAILWNDTRSATEADALVDAFGGQWWAERMGVVPVAAFTVSSWAWLREHEPETVEQVAAVRLPHDWLTERLTGEAVTDRGDTSGTGWWSTATEDYEAEVLDHPMIRLDAARLPEVRGPGDAAGTVASSAAEAVGLRPGIPVGVGTGDNMGAALGLGLEPGVPVISLGTSGTAYAVSKSRVTDSSGTVAGFADATGRFLPLACTLNCTLAVDRIAEWLGIDREEVADGGAVVVVPFLDGERTPNLPDASGLVVGLRHETTPGQILRSAYEGAVLSLLDALELVPELDADAPLILIGGGAQGRAWQDTVRRLSGRAVVVPEVTELVAIGAAAQAAGVLAGEPPENVARRWDTGRGTELEAVSRDVATLERHRAVRRSAESLVSFTDRRP